MPRIATIFLRHLRLAFVLLIVASVGAALYLLTNGIRVDYNVESFLPDDDPVIENYRAFTEQFPADDAFVIVAFGSDSVFSRTVLRDIREMTEALEDIEGVASVSSLTNHERLRIDGDEIHFERVVDPIAQTDSLLDAQRRAILNDTTATGYLVSRAGDVAAFYIHMINEDARYGERQIVIAGIREITAGYADRYEFKYSGIPLIRNVYVDSIRDDTARYVGLATIVILLALFWLFRSVRAVVLPIAIVYLGVLWTITIMMLLGGALDVLSSAIAAIILVVGVADSVHLLSRFNDNIARGLERREAVHDMVVKLGSATFLTSVTTAIGFATLGTSSILPMRNFGIFSAIGVLATFVVSIIILAAALTWMKPPPTAGNRVSRRFKIFLDGIDRLCEHHWRAILVAAAGITVLAIAGASQIRVNSYANDDLGPRTKVYQDMVFIQDRLVSPFPFDILIEVDERDGLHDPQILRQVRQLQRYLDSEPAVGRTISIVDLLAELDRALNPDSAGDGIPNNPDLIAQYILLLEMVDPDRAADLISGDHSKLRIAGLVSDVGSARLDPMLDRIDSAAAEILSDDVRISRTGTVVIVSKITGLIIDSLLTSIVLAFFFISLIMAAIYRKPALLVISLLPNVFPLVVTAGFMGVLGIDIKPATAVIFSIAFGIAVDDTIHFLARFRQELAAGRDMRDAIHISVTGTGKAIVLTSVILMGGFSVLTTSQFQSSNYMGGLISLSILAAVAADMLILPSLLHAWSRFSTGSTREKPKKM